MQKSYGLREFVLANEVGELTIIDGVVMRVVSIEGLQHATDEPSQVS